MTDFKDDKSKSASGSKSFKDQILNELEEANRLKGIQDDGTVKSIVESLNTESSREIDPDFNWQEAAAKLKEQQEAAAKSAEQEQKLALKEARAIKKIQEEEHIRELNPLGEELEETEPLEESSAYASTASTLTSETIAPEIADVDLSGFTVPIPLKVLKMKERLKRRNSSQARKNVKHRNRQAQALTLILHLLMGPILIRLLKLDLTGIQTMKKIPMLGKRLPSPPVVRPASVSKNKRKRSG